MPKRPNEILQWRSSMATSVEVPFALVVGHLKMRRKAPNPQADDDRYRRIRVPHWGSCGFSGDAGNRPGANGVTSSQKRCDEGVEINPQPFHAEKWHFSSQSLFLNQTLDGRVSRKVLTQASDRFPRTPTNW